MTQLQTEVPEPLRDDLPCLLTVGRMADPAVGVLFLVFIGQRIFKGAAMQIQRHDITSRERALREPGHKREPSQIGHDGSRPILPVEAEQNPFFGMVMRLEIALNGCDGQT